MTSAEKPTWKLVSLFESFKERSIKLLPEIENAFKDWSAAGQQQALHRFARDKLQRTYDEEKRLCLERLDELQNARHRQPEEELPKPAPKPAPKAQAATELRRFIGEAFEHEDDFNLNKPARLEMERQHQQLQNQMARENAQGVQRISEQVGEVKQIFQDLASMVSEQGQMIETIETAADATAAHTRAANEELKKVAARQGKGGACVRWLFVISLLCLALTLYYRMNSGLTKLDTATRAPKIKGEFSPDVRASERAIMDALVRENHVPAVPSGSKSAVKSKSKGLSDLPEVVNHHSGDTFKCEESVHRPRALGERPKSYRCRPEV